MNKLTCGFLLAIAFGFAACQGEKVSAEKKEKKVDYALLPDSIYRAGSITKAIERATPVQKNESRRFFMSGLDLLANKKDAAASIEFFKEAIYYYPDEKSYSYLFQAYLKAKQLDLADSVDAALFGRIGYEESMFHGALIFAAKKDTASCLSDLTEAVNMGFMAKDRIVDEPLFDFLKDNRSFQGFLVSYFNDNKALEKRLFKAFAASFPDVELPYAMSHDSAAKFNYDRYISYDFISFVPGMRDSRFSRDVSNEYMYVGKFKTQSGLAFIYKSCSMIADTLNPVSVHLMLYDTLGARLSDTEIGCFCSPLSSRGFSIGNDLGIDVISYRIGWEQDPLSKGYAGNKIVSTTEEGRQRYVIATGNTLEEDNSAAKIAGSGN